MVLRLNLIWREWDFRKYSGSINVNHPNKMFLWFSPDRKQTQFNPMEEFPEELRTPPVALACLIGCPDVHPLITAHLHSQQPPINAVALPDFSKISMIPPKKPPRDTSEPPAGIIKRDWFSKHRTRIPAVVAAIFSSRDVSGDPAQWLQVCTDLDKLKYFPSIFYITLCNWCWIPLLLPLQGVDPWEEHQIGGSGCH